MASLTFSRRCTYIVIGAIYFMGGIEYAVILPSLWLYIHEDFAAQAYFLGFMLASFSLSGLFASPIFGRLSDKTRKTRCLLVIASLFEIGGNVMYFMGLSLPFLIASRLVSGVGTGGEAVIMGEIARFTAEEKRTGVISILIAVRQIGLLFGPGLNFFLREADFNLGIFKIDKYTSPGALMAVLWTVLLIVILLLYWEPEDIYNAEQRLARAQQAQPDTSLQNDGPDAASDRIMAAEVRIRNSSMSEHSPLLESSSEPGLASTSVPSVSSINSASHVSHYGSLADQPGTPSPHRKHSLNADGTSEEQHLIEKSSLVDDPIGSSSRLNFFCQEYIREEIIVLLLLQFNSIFNQVCLETFVTPLTDKFLQWGEFENSIMYSLAGLEVIAVFLSVRWFSRRLQDRTMLLVGGFILLAADGWSLYCLPSITPDTPHGRTLAMLIVTIVLDMVALPPLMVCAVSLVSKLTRRETQGLTQGLRRSVVGMGTILAPMWAGSTLPWLQVSFGVITGLMILAVLLLLLSFKRLKSPETVKKESVPTSVSA